MIRRVKPWYLLALAILMAAQVAAGPRQLGELCKEEAPSSESSDEEDETCVEGLDCVRAPLRKKCFPVTCASEAVQKAIDITGWDFENYAPDMMEQAGITMTSPMFRPFPSKEHLNVIDTESNDLKRFLDITKDNPPPLGLIAELFNECTGGNAYDNRGTGAGLSRKLLQEEYQNFRNGKGEGDEDEVVASDATTKKNWNTNKEEEEKLHNNNHQEEEEEKEEDDLQQPPSPSPSEIPSIFPSFSPTDVPSLSPAIAATVPAALENEVENMVRRRRHLQTTPSPSATPSRAPSQGPTPTPPPYTLYYGASWEFGACATYNGDVFWASNVNNVQRPQIAVLNNCFGVILGYDAGVGGLLGFAFTGDPVELTEGCKQMFPIFEVGPFALQVGFIDCEDPFPVVELTLGLSAGLSLPGYTSCTTTPLI